MNSFLTNKSLSVKTYGEGDTYLIENVFNDKESTLYFDSLLKDTKWQSMDHHGGKVPRLISIQHTNYDDYKPIYRHPVDIHPTDQPWDPTSKVIRDKLHKLLHVDFNHALIQLYRNGKDCISEHADKTLDIKFTTPIVNVSFGRTRNMKLRSKFKLEDGTRKIETIRLTHGSVFILGWKTNTRWTHAIKPDNRSNNIKSPDELIFDGQRISLTMRVIDTFMNKKTNVLIGQGAPKHPVTIKNENDYVDMIKVFGIQNRSYDYNWNELYGKGFHSTCSKTEFDTTEHQSES